VDTNSDAPMNRYETRIISTLAASSEGSHTSAE
jgi:hypothetical protein